MHNYIGSWKKGNERAIDYAANIVLIQISEYMEEPLSRMIRDHIAKIKGQMRSNSTHFLALAPRAQLNTKPIDIAPN